MAHKRTLSDALLGTIKAPSRGGRTRIQDSRIPGFLVEVSGRHKRFVIRARGHYRTLGRWPVVSVQEARVAALEFLRVLELGQQTPAPGLGTRPAASSSALVPSLEWKGPTLAEALAEYLGTKRLKIRTATDYRLCLARYWADYLERPLIALNADAVLARFRAISSPAQANYSLRIIRALFRFHNAAHDAALPIPTAKVLALEGAHSLLPRSRLIPDSYQRDWYHAVLNNTGPVAGDLFIFLACTGLRLGEALGLRWAEDIDLPGRALSIQDTKNGKPHSLPVGHRMAALLERRRGLAGSGSSRVFPINQRNVRKAVTRVLAACPSAPWSSHDLRRGFVSLAVRLDIPDRAVKRLVNHSERDVTGRHYVHLSLDALRPCMQAIEDALWGMWEGEREGATGPPR